MGAVTSVGIKTSSRNRASRVAASVPPQQLLCALRQPASKGGGHPCSHTRAPCDREGGRTPPRPKPTSVPGSEQPIASSSLRAASFPAAWQLPTIRDRVRSRQSRTPSLRAALSPAAWQPPPLAGRSSPVHLLIPRERHPGSAESAARREGRSETACRNRSEQPIENAVAASRVVSSGVAAPSVRRKELTRSPVPLLIPRERHPYTAALECALRKARRLPRGARQPGPGPRTARPLHHPARPW